MKKIYWHFFAISILLMPLNAEAQFWKCKKNKKQKSEVSNDAPNYMNNPLKFKLMENNFDKLFAEVDSLVGLMQNQYALEKNEKIKQKAEKEQHIGYYIKALTYSLSINEDEEKQTEATKWIFLKKEYEKQSLSFKTMIALTQADFLSKQFNNYRRDNNIATNDSSENPGEWSKKQLMTEINQLIDFAIKNNTSITKPEFLNPLVTSEFDVDATIEQVIVLKAIDILSNLKLSSSIQYKSPDFELASLPNLEFLKADFTQTNDPKNEFRILQLYQILLKKYHLFYDNQRLEYVLSIFPQKKEMLSVYQTLYKNEIENPYSNLIASNIVDILAKTNKKEAHAFAQNAVKKHPDFKGNYRLTNFINECERPFFNSDIERTQKPNEKILCKLEYNNLKTIYATVLKVNYIDYCNKKNNYRYNNTDFNYLKNHSIVSVQKIELPIRTDFKNYSIETAFNELEKGAYLMVFSSTENYMDSNKLIGVNEFFVSPYTILKNNKNSLTLINAMNNEIAKDVNYKIHEINYDKKRTYKEISKSKTEKDGEIEISGIKYNTYLIEIDNGSLFYEFYNNNYYSETKPKEQIQVKILTDRNLYRPGQTVYFKVIAYQSLAKTTLANKTFDIVLKNTNYEEKGKLTLKTNAYGSLSGKFELPKSGSNTGSFYIEVKGYSSHYFSVEEYKLPKYKASFETPTIAYKLKDKIEITGKAEAFAGYAIQGAKVVYSVKRREKQMYFWRYGGGFNPNSESITLINDETRTDEKGQFKVSFDAIPDENSNENAIFTYEINATITDLNGEVKVCSYSINLSKTDREIYIRSANENLITDDINIEFGSNNLQGKALPFSGTLEIYKLEKTAFRRGRMWENADSSLISEADFKKDFKNYTPLKFEPKRTLINSKTNTNTQETKWVINKNTITEAGEYLFIIKSKDGNGNPIESTKSITLFDNKAGAFNLATPLKIICTNGQTLEPGQTAKILIAGAVNSKVNFRIESLRGIILDKTITINQSSELVEFIINEKDRGNIKINATTVNDYRFYETEEFIVVPYSNKKIDIQLSSFRSDVEPGAKEKWTLKIKGPDSEKALTEMASVMYNQSLDQLNAPLDWDFDINKTFNSGSFNYSLLLNLSFFNELMNNNYEQVYNSINYKQFINIDLINSFNWSFSEGMYSRRDQISKRSSANSSGKKNKNSRENNEVVKYLGYETFNKSIDLNGKDEEEDNNGFINNSPINIRKDFKETAFFYPNLYADKDGTLTLEFTMPEALTQWRMMLLAHSTTMQTGYLEQSITTSKKLMVQPNMPRFLRQGDEISLSAKIINSSNAALEVNANILIKDLQTGKPLNWLSDAINGNNKLIKIEANGVSSVDFKMKIPDYVGMVSIAIVANNKTVSDGEEHSLLVLSNRSLVTETLPITIRKSGEQNLVFTHLKNNISKTLTHQNMAIEMSENPAWYAIQALPYMMEYPYECAEQTFTKLYANSIAKHLANNSTEIKKVYQTWAENAKNGNGLQSKLVQNQELKTTLIEETPWLQDANNETERMRRLGNLFDNKKLNSELEENIDKLEDMQLPNGAWAWFKGMNQSTYITQTIVIGFGKMKKMGIDISNYSKMINKAILFLDNEAEKDYKEYLKRKDLNFNPQNLQYLYCKSYFPEIGYNSIHEVVAFYLKNAETNWQSSGLMNMAQLLIAIKTLNPGSKTPDLILTAFDQNATRNEEMGMYWNRNIGGWYWFEATIETQAAIIEAYKTMGRTTEIKEMQIWLLRQKQTQNWKTTRSTADACYALLSNNKFIKNQQQVKVFVNNSEVKPSQKEAGTGYYKQTITKESINSQSGDIKIEAKTDDFAYGAIYWQYFEDLDKIKASTAGLSVTKRIFKLKNTATGTERIEIVNNEKLEVGDLLEVVLTVNCDRNLEYVHLKDGRASGTEPRDVLSHYHWQNGLGYYQSTRDASSNFFIDYMQKGSYQLSYILKVEQVGVFNSGIATVQCMYTPEYAGNSKAITIEVK